MGLGSLTMVARINPCLRPYKNILGIRAMEEALNHKRQPLSMIFGILAGMWVLLGVF